MFMLCVGLVFGSKNVQFHIICSPQNSIRVNTVEVDPHPDSSSHLHNDNIVTRLRYRVVTNCYIRTRPCDKSGNIKFVTR